MAKKRTAWPPEREELPAWKADGPTLVQTLAGLKGMSLELAERMVSDGNWPAEAAELAQRYGLTQMDAEAVLKVLNENRGTLD